MPNTLTALMEEQNKKYEVSVKNKNKKKLGRVYETATPYTNSLLVHELFTKHYLRKFHPYFSLEKKKHYDKDFCFDFSKMLWSKGYKTKEEIDAILEWAFNNWSIIVRATWMEEEAPAPEYWFLSLRGNAIVECFEKREVYDD